MFEGESRSSQTATFHIIYHKYSVEWMFIIIIIIIITNIVSSKFIDLSLLYGLNYKNYTSILHPFTGIFCVDIITIMFYVA